MINFICDACKNEDHFDCRGRSHCDCHHKPIPRPEPGTPSP